MSYLLDRLELTVGREVLLEVLASDRTNWEVADLLSIKPFQVAYLRANFMAIYSRKVSQLRLVKAA